VATARLRTAHTVEPNNRVETSAGLAINSTGLAGRLQQLDEMRALQDRARELFGANPIEAPTDIAPPDPDSVKTWLR